MKKTSLGLDENVEAVLAYILGFISGIIFLLLEKESNFVKFHAKQSIVFSVFVIVVSWILGIIPFVGFVFATLFNIGAFIVWIILMFKAYNNEEYELPVIGEFARKIK